ncbi:MAG: type II toxin-antitoxin system VapC family toxin [Luteolibacter sp.]
MDHLVDTCALIFFLEDSPQLPEPAARVIENPLSRSFISLASLWEITLKHVIGKLDVGYANTPELPELLKTQGFELLPIDWESMRLSARLPFHHRDPFDRLLIAEAQRKNLPIVSPYLVFDRYEVRRIWK